MSFPHAGAAAFLRAAQGKEKPAAKRRNRAEKNNYMGTGKVPCGNAGAGRCGLRFAPCKGKVLQNAIVQNAAGAGKACTNKTKPVQKAGLIRFRGEKAGIFLMDSNEILRKKRLELCVLMKNVKA